MSPLTALFGGRSIFWTMPSMNNNSNEALLQARASRVRRASYATAAGLLLVALLALAYLGNYRLSMRPTTFLASGGNDAELLTGVELALEFLLAGAEDRENHPEGFAQQVREDFARLRPSLLGYAEVGFRERFSQRHAWEIHLPLVLPAEGIQGPLEEMLGSLGFRDAAEGVQGKAVGYWRFSGKSVFLLSDPALQPRAVVTLEQSRLSTTGSGMDRLAVFRGNPLIVSPVILRNRVTEASGGLLPESTILILHGDDTATDTSSAQIITVAHKGPHPLLWEVFEATLRGEPLAIRSGS